MNKFKNRYRIKSNRLEVWDYGNISFYYITICTKNRINYLSEIKDNEIHLTKIGGIVKTNIEKIIVKFPKIEIDKYIIMPNHIHLIIFIKDKLNNPSTIKEGDTINRVSTNQSESFKVSNPMKNNSISTIVRWLKAKSTYEIRHKLDKNEFGWQRNYHDHIIRNEKELEEIRKYIEYNPHNWEEDDYYS